MMKRVKDGRRIIRGQIQTGTYQNRVQLFDGLFTSGYKITEFVIIPELAYSLYEATAILSTEPKSSLGQINMQDVQELAWAGWNLPSQTSGISFSLISEDNMAIEDLWLSGHGGNTGENFPLNYYIVLEKYEFPAWDGAAILVENLSQGGPQ